MDTAERIALAVSIAERHMTNGMDRLAAYRRATENLTPYERDCVLAKLRG